jgi:serine/threonine protein kinase
MDESVPQSPVKGPVCGEEPQVVDYGTTINLDPAATTQGDVAIQTNDVLAAPGLGNSMHTDASAPESTRFKTPTGRMDDRSVSALPEIGRVLRNRYVLESRLGSGGMGTVFKAMDRYRCDLAEDNQHVAIKFLHEETDSRSEVLSNLRREFYCAQALSHRSIVKVYEMDWDDDVAFFTMELLEGELLSAALERSPPFSRSYAWAIILEVGDALAHAHARNVVHGDLKPSNIMITNSGELRILDFGASHAPTRKRLSTDESPKVKLTPAYACCELLEGQQADPRDDLYALACLSYELLAGMHPFHRRRSTEARDRGLVARRPPGLTRRQWRTLAMGLSWSREGRSISVRDWVANLTPRKATARRSARLRDLGRSGSIRDYAAKLNPKRTAMRRLVRLLARCTELSYQRISSPFVKSAIPLLALLSVSLTVWVSINRASFEGKMSAGNVAVPMAAANTLINADPMTRYQYLLLDGNPLPGLGAMWPQAPGGEMPTLQPSTFAATVKSAAARTASHNGKSNRFSIAAAAYTIPSRERFAEIHVRRVSGYDGDTRFVWWTEPSSAKPGIDYVPQARMIQFLPKGKHLASLFIRIIPNASRKHSAMFYVAIGDPSNGTTVRHLARTAILLPPSI